VIPNLPVTGLSVTTSAPTSGAYVFAFVSLTCTLVIGCNYAWCDSKPPCDWFVCDNELNMYTCDGMQFSLV